METKEFENIVIEKLPDYTSTAHKLAKLWEAINNLIAKEELIMQKLERAEKTLGDLNSKSKII